jgi:MotA/TolQ/ExbB proton channel family protein
MTENIYQAPESSTLIDEVRPTSLAGKWLALIGSLLLLGLPIGIISTILSTIELFQSITLYGAGDSKVMAAGISDALISTVLGTVVALPGAFLVSLSILVFRHRRPWVYRVSIMASIFTFLLFPVGTLIAIIILVRLIRNKQSYFLSLERALD